MDDQWYLGISIYIYGCQNRPARSIFLKLLKLRVRRRFTPPTTNTCSNDYPITLAGQSLRKYE
jgi:hypothetical protein